MSEFTIRRAKNGYIIKDADCEEIVYQDNDSDDELESFANFLRELDYQYGPSTSRYQKQIKVFVVPGDKSSEWASLEECPLCYSKLQSIGVLKQIKDNLPYLQKDEIKLLQNKLKELQKFIENQKSKK